MSRHRHRTLAGGLILLTAFALGGVLVVRSDAAGVDTMAYWYWTRVWLDGGDPYQTGGPALPYVYAPWALPLFVPLAVLPWEMALIVWRAVTLLGLAASVWWAYRRSPLLTAVMLVGLSVPLGINLETGNVTLILGLAAFGAQLVDQRLTGIVLGVATGMKWITLPLILVLDRTGQRWGMGALVIAALASLILLPATLDQVRTLLANGRPLPLDYLVLAWALLPWAIRHQWLDDTTDRHLVRSSC